MFDPQTSRERMNPINVGASIEIIHDFNSPIIMLIANRFVSITRNFIVQFRNRRQNSMRMEVTCRWNVIQPDDVTMLEEPHFVVWVVRRFVPTREDSELVIIVFEVVTRNLLLI